MTIDGFRRQLFPQQIINIIPDHPVGHLLNRLVHPDNELLKIVQIASNGVG